MQHDSVYLGLGSNLGNRPAELCAGLAALKVGGLRLRAVSSLYLTEPQLGDVAAPRSVPSRAATEHPWYVNCVAAFDGPVEPPCLLDLCLAVEAQRGRQRSEPRAGEPGIPSPRPLDIDVLLIGARVVDRPGLRVPHPRMDQRRFVLQPLAEIAPRARHPVAGTTVRDMLDNLGRAEGVWLLAPPPAEVI